MVSLPKLPRLNGLAKILPLVVIAALVIGAGATLLKSGGTKTVTAMFPRTVSVYEGSDVRVLGVKVGEEGGRELAG